MDHPRALPTTDAMPGTYAAPVLPGEGLSDVSPTFGRLAIVDRKRQVLAYALPVLTALDGDVADAAAAASLHQVYRTVDLEKYVADRPAFIWSTPAMLAGHESIPPSQGGVGLLVHPTATRRADGAEQIIALSEKGTPTVLVKFAGEPGQRALLPFVSHVMVDVADGTLDLGELVTVAHNAGVTVIAENVQGTLGPAKAWGLGVDFLMGSIYHNEKPTKVRSLDPGEIQCLEVVRLLSAPEVDTTRIAEVLSSDPEMTVRVLHLVNSVAIGLPQRVDSLHRAIIMLGPSKLTTLVMASLISSRIQQMDALWFLLARAAACRELAGDDAGYTVGLLSAFSEETGIPVSVLVEKSLVSEEVARALDSYEGHLGATLAAVVAHEHGDAAGVAATAWRPEQVAHAYLVALPWALETVRQLNLT